MIIKIREKFFNVSKLQETRFIIDCNKDDNFFYWVYNALHNPHLGKQDYSKNISFYEDGYYGIFCNCYPIGRHHNQITFSYDISYYNINLPYDEFREKYLEFNNV